MTDAPERIWADGDETGLNGFCDWLWVRGSWNRSKEGVGEVEYIRADLVEALKAENQRLRGVLAWYGEQARLARLIHSEGDAGRRNLDADGGSRARAALRNTEASHDD